MNTQKTQAKSFTRLWHSLPQSLIYGLFLLLSIGSIYWVFIDQGQVFYGDDMGFHLGRIEGLTEALQQGNWFPRINYFITGGLGYASGIFYPDLFLYPAALLRSTGLTIAQSYVVYLILVTWGTFVISYHSCLYLTKNKGGGLVFAFLYGLSSYRMSDVIYRAAVGEILAFMVLPIAFIGLYEVIQGNQKRWWLLSLGMTLLFYAHLLSAGIFMLFGAGFIGLNGVSLWRDKKRLLQLLKSAGLTILLTAYALFPMLEQLQFQTLRVQEEPVFYLQRMAESPQDYLRTAINNIGFNNIGLPTLVFFVIGLVCYRKLDRLNRQLMLLAGVFLFVATDYFPHWLFHGTPLNAVQFPWRYFILVTFCVSWVVGTNSRRLFPQKQTVSKGLLIAALVFVSVNQVYGQYTLTKFDQRRTKAEQLNQLDGTANMGYGREFLPSRMNSWISTDGFMTSDSDQIKLTKFTRKKNVFSIQFEAEAPTRILLPLIYYKGYETTFQGNGSASQPEDGGVYNDTDMHGFIQIEVSGQGEVTLAYTGTRIQTWSSFISAGTLLVCLGYGIRIRRRKK